MILLSVPSSTLVASLTFRRLVKLANCAKPSLQSRDRKNESGDIDLDQPLGSVVLSKLGDSHPLRVPPPSSGGPL